MKKFCSILFAGLSLGLQAEIVTNKWVATTGGRWTDPANWSDPVMLGTNDATAAFFDLSGMPNGATNLVPFVEGNSGIRIYGLVLGSESSPTNETWALLKDSNFPADKSTLFKTMKNPDAGNFAEIQVNSGVMRIDGVFSGNASILKTGSGVVRFASYANQTVDFRVMSGALEVVHPETFKGSVVNLYTPDAAFRPYGDQPKYYVKRIDSTTGQGRPVDFLDRELAFTQNQEDGFQTADLITSSGGLSASSSATLHMNATQTGFTGAYRLRFGDIRFGYAVPGACAAYCFEDATVPGMPTQVGESLKVVGGVSVVPDDERGSVLSLDGTGYLSSNDPTKLPAGMCTGTGDYTVACWLKIDPGVDSQATLFYLGKWNTAGACSLLRLDPGTSSGKKGVMYTNFSNNRAVNTDATAALYDGRWHHLAVTRQSGTGQLWIDGSCVDTLQYSSADVKDGEFWIGYGKNGKYFKGRIDDFVFCTTALGWDRIASLMNGNGLDLSAAGPLPVNSIEAVQSGVMTLASTATVATLKGDSWLAKVRMNGGLTVQGTGVGSSETTVFRSEVTGSGDLVKKGADYTLVLSGANTYTGATRVAEGSLIVRGDARMNKLVGRWTFDDAARPGYDASGNGFDLTVSGVTVVDDADRGRVASFSGSAKLSSTIYPEEFPMGNDDYTLSLWVKGTSACSPTAGVAVWGKTGSDNLCVLWRLDGSAGWMMTNWNQNHMGNGQSFRDGRWHHVVWTRNGSEQRVYIDGSLVHTWTRSGNIDVTLTGTTFNLGFNPASSVFFTGLMDDVRVYNYSLSSAEALSEYQGTVAADSIRDDSYTLPEPDYCWAFEDPALPGANSGTAEDGTLAVVGNARCAEVEGRPGKVLDLTGTTMSYLTAETFPSLVPTGATPWTVTFWAQSTASITGNDCMLYWGDPQGQFALFGFWDATGRFRVTTKSESDVATQGCNMKPISAEAKWHHVAVVCNDSRIAIYLDGNLNAGGGVGTVNLGSSVFWIGRKASSETDWFRGYLDEVKIFRNRALDAATIQRMIRAERFRTERPILPETTDVDVAEGAVFSVEATDQKVASLAGSGTVQVSKGSALTVSESGTYDGRLELDSLDCLSLPQDVVLKVGELTVGGVRKGAGVFKCGDGALMVGSSGTVILFR